MKILKVREMFSVYLLGLFLTGFGLGAGEWKACVIGLAIAIIFKEKEGEQL